MRSALHGFLALALASSCAAASALALAHPDGVQAGWAPMISWWGGGDPKEAVQNLTQLTGAFSAVLHRTDIDAPTQRFMDESLEELSDFDLHDFHDLLPDRRGSSRELRVRGDLKAGRYTVKRAESSQPFAVTLRGPRRGLADFSQVIRAQLHQLEDQEDSYLIGLQLGLGVGALSWDKTMDALADFGRIVSNADPRTGVSEKPRASTEALGWVKKLHPKLAPEDVESTALLFDAYPNVSRAFSQIGQLEDVRSIDSSKGYQHVSVRMRGRPERLAERHPEFASHMAKLGDIAHFDLRWVDSRSRTLVKAVVDSESLVIGLECYLKDGALLPFSGKKVFAEEGVGSNSDVLQHTRLFVHARVQIFGVSITLSNLKGNVSYLPHGSYASITGSVTSVPKVEVEGAAASFIDVFIPGNIQSLTEDFFRRAAQGNEKRGIVIGIQAGSERTDGEGVVESRFEIEALDSRLVKLGVGMVNDRLMPSSETLDDGKLLLTEIHDGFVADLARYKQRLGS